MNKNYKKHWFRCAVMILFLRIIFPTGFMLQAQTSNPVGFIPGAIDVLPTGVVTYTIPIEVVPGTQGIQPNLSIVFNSFGGMGLLGMKWDLAGLSAISRCGQTPYYDNGNITAIQFNNNDKYSLDGERLLSIGNNTYATEMENFTQVVLVSGTSTYFRAYTDDGSIVEYGATADSRQQMGTTSNTLSWQINKITDADGNYMTFHYGRANGEIWVNEIRYLYNNNAQHYAKVEFLYSTLPELMGRNTHFIKGFAISRTKLLQAIRVYYDNTIVRRYQFNYNLNDSGESTVHLKDIVLYDDGLQRLKATTITWGDKNDAKPNQILSNLPAGYIITGDFNGDGYTDYVLYGQTTHQNEWTLYTGSATGVFTKTEIAGKHTTINNNGDGGCFVYKADLDGDACDELIIIGQTAISEDYEVKVLSLKDSIKEINKKTIKNFYQVLFGDFDGNGSTDMLFVSKDSDGNCSFQFYINSQFISSALGLPSLNLPCKVRVGDFNGDGKADIELNYNNNSLYTCYLNSSSGGFILDPTTPNTNIPYNNERYSGDFNGDGITDLLTYDYNNSSLSWKLYFGKGDGTYTEPTNITHLDTKAEVLQNGWVLPVCKIIIADLDGDGKDEIIQLFTSTTLRILYSKGCVDDNINTHKYKYEHINKTISGANFSHPKNFNIADFNNDGILDIIVRDRRDHPQPRVIYLHQNKQYEFPKNITDGMEKTWEFVFSPKYLLTKNGSHTKKYFFHILDNLKISNGLNAGLNSFTYKYNEPVFSFPRRTFLGFNEFVSINNQENKEDSLLFAVHGSTHSIIPVSKKTSYGNVHWDEITYNFSFKSVGGNRYMPYSNETTVKNIVSDIKTVTTTTLYSTGRLEQSETKTYNSCNTTTWMHAEINTYSYETISLGSNQKKTVPKRILTTQQFGSNTPLISDTITYGYTAGRLAWGRKGNLQGAITTSYGDYNNAGVYKEKTISAAGCTTRIEQYEYDGTSRFITQVTNPAGHTTAFAYDAKTGNKLSETDPNGLTITYSYDTFGNLTQITYPDGTVTKDTIYWFSASNLPNAQYCTKTTSTGKPELIVYYDILGREVCRKDDGYYYETRYNNKGQVEKNSYPFSALNDPNKIWHEYTYDNFGRKSRETAPYIDLSYKYPDDNRKRVIVTDHLRDVSSFKTHDALGRIVSATDHGGTINYNYDVVNESGKRMHLTTIATNGATTQIKSDLWGNRLSIEEPNAGKITSEYNKFNELVKQTDANGNITTYQYDVLERVVAKQITGSGAAPLNIQYTYDNYTSNNRGRGKIYQIVVNGIVEESFFYNNLSRLWKSEKVIDNATHTFLYDYTPTGQLHTLTYPSGFAVTYNYTSSGKLSAIHRSSHNNNDLIYKVISRNEYQQPLRCDYGNDLATYYTYNTHGVLTRIRTGNKIKIGTGGPVTDEPHPGDIPGDRGEIENAEEQSYIFVDSAILNYRYAYDTKGLMISRSEGVLKRLEEYEYDKLDRLTKVASGSTGSGTMQTQTFSYHNNGNLNNNSVGYYAYLSGNKPHAVNQIELINNNVISNNQCNVTYNFFNQPSQITEGNHHLDLFYGSNQQRNKAERYRDGVLENTRYYISKYYEKEIDSTNTPHHYHYIYGGHGVVALHIATIGSNSADTMSYIHTDHLGSYCAITNATKKVVQRNYFDPWGNFPPIRLTRSGFEIEEAEAPQDTISWQDLSTMNFTLTHRGFTGHEHYLYFKIINMNGRLYDPVIGRFFSPDNIVQLPEFSQSFNRYSYCLNNPLKFVDPSGQWLDDYGLTKMGYIKKLRDTFDDFDRLIALNENEKETDRQIKVYKNNWKDKSILYDLWQAGKEGKSDFSYAVTGNISTVFNVFKFAAENSAVEWKIDGYRTNSGTNEYFIGTSHKPDAVSHSYTMPRFNEFNLIFEMHSHLDNTKGASYADYGHSDISNIRRRHNRFIDAGMKDISIWFNANGITTVFPKHYIYHVPTNALYHYTPWKQSVYIRNVNSAKGLYYNLGF